jgi:hypothetical protein
MVVNRVQQVFAIVVARDEGADPAVDRARRGSGFDEAAFDGEIHDERGLLKHAVIPYRVWRHSGADMSELVTSGVF